MATGYNGVPCGLPHCSEGHPCSAAHAAPGEALDGCLATHAEPNALLQCQDVRRIVVAYCTDSPCLHCVKLLINTGCCRVCFEREYPHKEAADFWLRSRPDRLWARRVLQWPFALERGHHRESEKHG
jgi:dCMP deaminase